MKKANDKSYDPQVAGMLLRQAYCLLEKANKDIPETQRRREIVRQWELERKKKRLR